MASEPAPPWLAILGIGEDGVEGLSATARHLLSSAEFVAGGARHLALAGRLIGGERLPWPSPITDALPAILARRGRPTAVLASGDPCCYGVASLFFAQLSAPEIAVIPTPSAFSLACARLGWRLQDAATISFCGRPLEAVRPLLQNGTKLLVLSAGAQTPAALMALLRRYGFGQSVLHILESLGGAREQIRTVRADAAPPDAIGDLNMIAAELRAAPDAPILHLAGGLPDDLFAHDGQITKREIRAITLSALRPGAGEMLWDIGGGSGSVAIEWMLRHRLNRAIAVERRADRAACIARNALALGVPALRIANGSAPEALAGLPAPDAVFLGGGATRETISCAWNGLQAGGRIVANSVTAETDMLFHEARQCYGGSLIRIAIERLEPLGTMHGFQPSRAVTQWSVRKA